MQFTNEQYESPIGSNSIIVLNTEQSGVTGVGNENEVTCRASLGVIYHEIHSISSDNEATYAAVTEKEPSENTNKHLVDIYAVSEYGGVSPTDEVHFHSELDEQLKDDKYTESVQNERVFTDKQSDTEITDMMSDTGPCAVYQAMEYNSNENEGTYADIHIEHSENTGEDLVVDKQPEKNMKI